MSKKLVLTFIICSLWLDAARPDGSQLSKCRSVQGKSCGTKLVDTGQNMHDQGDHLLLNNTNLHGRLRLRSRTLMSTPELGTGSKAGKSGSMFINNLHQQWQHQPLDKQRQVWPATYRRSRHSYLGNTSGNPGSVVKLQQPRDSAANRSDQWHNGQLDMAIAGQKQKSSPINQSKQDLIGLRAHSGDSDALEKHDMNTRSDHHFHMRNGHPHLMSLDHDHTTELWHASSHREKDYGKLLTESTTIHPFIGPRQALDYLTSYDSKPPPRRWPLRLILPEREHNTIRVRRAGVGGTVGSTDGHVHGSWTQRRKNRHARSTVHTLRQVNEDRTRGEVQHEDHVKAKGKLTYNNTTIGEFEDDVVKYDDSVVSDKSQGQQMNHVINENTRDIQRPQRTAGSVPTDAETAKRGNRKRKNRVRQQLQKRKKKLRKRKKQRIQMKSEGNFTTIATNDIAQLSSTDSVHVLLPSLVFQRHKDEQIAKNTSNEQNKTTEMNASQLLKSEGASVLKLLAEASGNTQIPGGNLSNQTSEERVPPESLGHNNLDAGVDTYVAVTSQRTLTPRQLPANRNKSKNKNKKLKGKSNNLNVSIQTENITDNHMFVSLKPDFSPTFFDPVNSKAMTAGTGVKALLENYSQESANVSSDNTRQIVSDRNLVAHLPARTNSGLHNTQDVTSSKTWPISGTVWTNNYSTTEEVSTSTRKHSAGQEMSQSQPMLVKNKAANVDEHITVDSAESVVSKLRNVSLNSSSLTTSMAPPNVNTPQRSSAEFWKTRLRKTNREIPYGEDHQQDRNSGNSKYDNKRDERRASLGYQKLASKSTERNAADSAEKGNQETPENGPFIGYKTAYDFLAQQKGPKMNPHNEARREGNELNRFMGEGMCEIFNKHYVPTRIGGKCQ